MVKTGYISFITESGGGQDVDGNPVASTKVASAFIQCNLMVLTKEYRTLVDGQYLQGNYACYIEQSKVPTGIDLETVKEVNLNDNNGNLLNVISFQVQNIEYLNLTKRVKLVV